MYVFIIDNILSSIIYILDLQYVAEQLTLHNEHSQRYGLNRHTTNLYWYFLYKQNIIKLKMYFITLIFTFILLKIYFITLMITFTTYAELLRLKFTFTGKKIPTEIARPFTAIETYLSLIYFYNIW